MKWVYTVVGALVVPAILALVVGLMYMLDSIFGRMGVAIFLFVMVTLIGGMAGYAVWGTRQ